MPGGRISAERAERRREDDGGNDGDTVYIAVRERRDDRLRFIARGSEVYHDEKSCEYLNKRGDKKILDLTRIEAQNEDRYPCKRCVLRSNNSKRPLGTKCMYCHETVPHLAVHLRNSCDEKP